MKSISIRVKLSNILWFIFICFCSKSTIAQSYDLLEKLSEHKIEVYYSKGFKKEAITMASRCDRVIAFYQPIFKFTPEVTLLMLSPEDWSTYTGFPVYGMPHYINQNTTLIVATENNDFWDSFIPALDQLSDELAKQVIQTYTDHNEILTMKGFFDLLAIHELGHAFHGQGKLNLQRKWMEELFANIFLHTFIAENEPELLPPLTVFPRMVLSLAKINDLKFTSLGDLESNYNTITQQYPNNYGWYQSKLHVAAADIYDEAGTTVIINLWLTFKNKSEIPEDAELIELLFKSVHPVVAEIISNWSN